MLIWGSVRVSIDGAPLKRGVGLARRLSRARSPKQALSIFGAFGALSLQRYIRSQIKLFIAEEGWRAFLAHSLTYGLLGVGWFYAGKTIIEGVLASQAYWEGRQLFMETEATRAQFYQALRDNDYMKAHELRVKYTQMTGGD